MLTHELKDYIIENDEIIHILESLNCHHIKEFGKEYRAGLPEHSNKTAIAINKTTTKVKIFQPNNTVIRGDVLTLCMHILNISFPESNKQIHNLLGLEYKFIKQKESVKTEIDPLRIFKKVKTRNNLFNVNDIELYSDDILRDYVQLPHIDWIRDGIMPWTCEKFNIGYSTEKKRIVIPIRHWCGEENEYLGIIGRTTVPEYSIFDIPKYFPLKPYSKSINIYGLQENYKSIQENQYCIVYEAEKSVLKRHSRKDETGVAIGSHSLSDEQVKILIGLDVSIIIAYDKDIPLNYIRSECERFYQTRNIYYIYDKYDLLKDKDSPADANNKIFNYLLKYKTLYNEKEHNEYLKGLK